ncbi:MAG: BTAD domain-containing putative transcriptional regulator, partial [Longimicrobiales bacterium]
MKLFGGVTLEGPGGLVRGRAVQRRQLSLLAVLAGSRAGLLSRDKVVALLWPELPASRARPLLSDAVHVLRKSLGEGAIRVSGADLGLNADVIWCDVPAFWAAVGQGDPAGAVALYEGPFLDGFHVSGAAEFERWVDGERAEVQRVARRAAGDLMMDAERAGDLTAAARWARRALTIEPYDETAAGDLIRLLAASGERAAALQAYESFSALLRDDLELDVAPETAALIAAIRADASEEPVRSLAILPLENLSTDPEQEYFVAGMHDALIGEIARIDGVRVISRTSTLAFRGGRESVPAIARALDVDAVLEGTVLRDGDCVRIQLQLIRARPEEQHLWAQAYDREIHDVLALHREVTRAIAREIRAQLTPGVEQRLARTRRVEPASYEALLQGNFHINKFTPEGFRLGLAYLQKAVEEDPSDPLAHGALALGYSQFGHESGNPGELFPRARAAALRALELDPSSIEALEALAETNLY